MITIVDNIFMPHQMELFRCRINSSHTEEFISGYSSKPGEGFFRPEEIHINEVMCKGILKEVNNYVNLDTSIGYEYWTHTDTRPTDKHQDKDEVAYITKGISRFPMCSSVYYLTVENLTGGELVFDDVTITPVQNRLVIFKKGLEHYVNPFEGTRVSIAVNPWDTKLYK